MEAKTYRLISLERHNVDGKLRVKIDHVEYDTDFPDSVFQPTLPPGAIVEDGEAPPRATPRARYRTWEAEAAAEAKAHKDVSLFGGMNVGAGAAARAAVPSTAISSSKSWTGAG